MARYISYLKTVLAHRWWAFVYCCRLGVPWLGIIHDLSKLSRAEFGPYARRFYLPSGRKRSEPPGPSIEWDEALRHHYRHNPHHWEYWCWPPPSVLEEQMPVRYLREMVADWMAAGRIYSGKCQPRTWYEGKRHTIRLHPASRLYVEALLKEIEPWETD